MTLSARLSAFFLGALAAVLVGFSAALFASAWYYLHHQVEERLNASLAVLAAAAEITPGTVEWEPHERELPLGRDAGADRLRWMIFDDRGHPVDRSTNLDNAELTAAWSPRPGAHDLPGRLSDRRASRGGSASAGSCRPWGRRGSSTGKVRPGRSFRPSC